MMMGGKEDPLNEGFNRRDMEVDINDQRYGWPTPPPSDWEREFKEGKIKRDTPTKRTPMEAYGMRHKQSFRERLEEKFREEGGADYDHDAATYTMTDALASALAELVDAADEVEQVVERLVFNNEMDHGSKQKEVEAASNDAQYMTQALLELRDRLKKFRRW